MPAVTRNRARLQAQTLPDRAPLRCIAGAALIFLGLQLLRLVSNARGQPACCAHAQTASHALGTERSCIFAASKTCCHMLRMGCAGPLQYCICRACGGGLGES